jgi:hypothetical protein
MIELFEVFLVNSRSRNNFASLARGHARLCDSRIASHALHHDALRLNQ